MKILFVSMPSLHAIRWMENLKDSPHELYWFDVLDRGAIQTNLPITQFTGWKKRKRAPIKGEYFLSKNFPKFYNRIQNKLEVTAAAYFEELLNSTQPDVVHSFEMQHGTYPITEVMAKFPHIPWLYSCWGSDLYYFQNFKQHKIKIQRALQRINFLHTDCNRDWLLATELGFQGKHTGVIPGGGGYDLEKLMANALPFDQRDVILIKGYQHDFGRALPVVKAISGLEAVCQQYKVVVFGAHQSVIEYVKQSELPITVYDRGGLSHSEVLALMGKSILYIGNSISDGIPNTLLEALIMQVFPIQSNPGNVTTEYIEAGINGQLIQNPEDVNEIREIIRSTLQNQTQLQKAMEINKAIAQEKLNFGDIKSKINAVYDTIYQSFKQ